MGRLLFLTCALIAFFAVCCVAAPSVVAQQDDNDDQQRIQVEDQGDGAQRIIFDRSFFGEFNVLTALDIIDRIPGASISGTGGNRGLGTQGNVLVNGQRVSGKSNDARSTLERIPAATVERIELIRGIVPGIDVRGGGQLINVVLAEDRSRISGTYQANIRFPATGDFRLGGEATANFDFDDFSALIGLEFGVFEEPGDGPELVTDGLGQLVETRLEETGFDRNRGTFTGNFSWNFSGRRSLDINTRLEFIEDISFEVSDRFLSDGALLENRFFDSDEDEWSGEVGVDWKQPIGEALSWQSIFVQRMAREEEFTVDSIVPAGGVTTLSELAVVRDTGETILRNTLDWRLGGGHTLRFGLEGAYNFLDSELSIAADDGDGLGLQEVELANSNTRVEEWRGEAFVTHTWQIDPTSTLDTLVAVEASNISQSGDTELSRTFVFLKPEITWTKNLTPQDQLRLQVRRRVGQLDFDDFVSTVDLRDETEATGNPDLSPQQRTRLQLTYEHRWPNDLARVRLRPFYLFLDDVIDLVPVSLTDDAPGNIGSGERYGFEIEANARLDGLGLKGGFISGEFEWGDSSVTDPLTGENREISGRSNVRWEIEYRQDLTDIGVAYGFSVENRSERIDFETNEEDRTFQTPFARVFVEWATPLGVTLEAGVRNVFNQRERRERTLFQINRLDGAINVVENRERRSGRLVFVNVRGTF